MATDLRGLFGHLFGGFFDDFLGVGAVAPESIPRRLLGVEAGAPLEVIRVHQAFRRRIRALRPDLTERQADDLRRRPAAAQPQEEALTELLWAREELLRRAEQAEAERKARDAAIAGGGVAATGCSINGVPGSRHAEETVAQQLERLSAAGARRAAEVTWADLRAPNGRWRGYRREYVNLEPGKIGGEREAWVTRTETDTVALSDIRNVPAPACRTCGEALGPDATAYLDGGRGRGAPRCEACYRADRWHFFVRARGRCAVCDRPVARGSSWPPTITCSPACKALVGIVRQRERRLEARPKVCAVCGAAFDATRADQVTCSAACRQKAYRQRRRVSAGTAGANPAPGAPPGAVSSETEWEAAG